MSCCAVEIIPSDVGVGDVLNGDAGVGSAGMRAESAFGREGPATSAVGFPAGLTGPGLRSTLRARC